MGHIGFNEKWINLMIGFVGLVSSSMLINVKTGEKFKLARELRQCNPLKPNLFILCAKRLNSFLNKVKNKGGINGAATFRGDTKLNYLMFTNDFVIFSRATWAN